jgi:hypothetical protein
MELVLMCSSPQGIAGNVVLEIDFPCPRVLTASILLLRKDGNGSNNEVLIGDSQSLVDFW